MRLIALFMLTFLGSEPVSEQGQQTASLMGLLKSIIGVANDGFAGLNTALQFANGIKSLVRKDNIVADGEVREKLIDLTDQLLTVKEQNAALRLALLEMEEALAKLESFDAEAEHYVLEEIGPNSFAYVAKDMGEPPNPRIRLCAHCFTNRRKSILQFSRPDYKADILQCPTCLSDVHFAVDKGPMIMTVPRDRTLF